MLQYVIRRVAGILVTVWSAVTISFLLLQIVPGDPAEAALSQTTSSVEVLEKRRVELGLDKPVTEQYLRFLSRLTRGDFGTSWYAGQPVGELLRVEIPPTITLAAAGMIFACVTGLVLGIGSSPINQNRAVSTISRNITSILLATPVMFTGVLLVWIFAVLLDWLPATGQGDIRSLVLPAIVVGLSASGGIARTVDAGLGGTLSQPYMQTALAKGLTRRMAVFRHALRVGILPALDIIALQFGYLLGGAVVTEAVFSRQGIGRLMVTAVLSKDIPLVQGVIIVSALSFSVLSLLADIVHAWLDPRIRLGEEQ